MNKTGGLKSRWTLPFSLVFLCVQVLCRQAVQIDGEREETPSRYRLYYNYKLKPKSWSCVPGLSPAFQPLLKQNTNKNRKQISTLYIDIIFGLCVCVYVKHTRGSRCVSVCPLSSLVAALEGSAAA